MINYPTIKKLNSVFEKGWYYPQAELQDCFYESDCFDENRLLKSF